MSLLKEVSSKEQLFIDLLKNASRLRLLRWTTFKIMNVKGDKQFVRTSALLWCSLLYDKSSSSLLSSFTYIVEVCIFLSLLYVREYVRALLSTFLNRLKMKLFPENEWWLHIQIERERWRRRWRRSFMNQIRGHSAVCLLNKQQLFFNKQKVKLQLNFVQLCWNNAKFN